MNNLNAFVDECGIKIRQEIKLVDAAKILVKDLNMHLKKASKSIFAIANLFSKMSSNFGQLEKLGSEDLLGEIQISQTLEFGKLGLEKWSLNFDEHLKTVQSTLNPFLSKLKEDFGAMKTVL